MSRLTIKDIKKVSVKRKISMLTCYDFSFAHILDEADIDIVLVGDSLANVILGMEETRNISIEEMYNHTKAVSLGIKKSLVVADMPYLAYQKNPKECVRYARKFIKAGADAVKIEWFKDCAYVVKRLIKDKIPVMGHIGLTPQTVHLLGGYKVQGKTRDEADELLKQAKILQDLGVFSIVLECIPWQVSKEITKKIKVPTLGIGAGKYCDGQVLVLYDLLGLYKKKSPKFVKVYEDLFSQAKKGIKKYIKDINSGKFPSKKESFSLVNKPKKS